MSDRRCAIRALFKAAKREAPFNPEVAPSAVWGDVGFVIPELTALERDMQDFGWRLVRVAAGIAAAFTIVCFVIAIVLWLR